MARRWPLPTRVEDNTRPRRFQGELKIDQNSFNCMTGTSTPAVLCSIAGKGETAPAALQISRPSCTCQDLKSTI